MTHTSRFGDGFAHFEENWATGICHGYRWIDIAYFGWDVLVSWVVASNPRVLESLSKFWLFWVERLLCMLFPVVNQFVWNKE